MEITNKEIKESTLQVADILFVPTGFYRWIKRENKETGDLSSKLENNLMQYVVAPCADLVKTGLIALSFYELMK